jgi:hypothetical protein
MKTLSLNSSLTGIINLYNHHNQFSIILKCIDSFVHPCTLMDKSSNRFQTVCHYNINTRNKERRKKEKGRGK